VFSIPNEGWAIWMAMEKLTSYLVLLLMCMCSKNTTQDTGNKTINWFIPTQEYVGSCWPCLKVYDNSSTIVDKKMYHSTAFYWTIYEKVASMGY